MEKTTIAPWITAVGFVCALSIYSLWPAKPAAAVNTIPSHLVAFKHVQYTEKPVIKTKATPKPMTFYREQASVEDNLKLAYTIATDVGVEPELVQAIMIQESRGGKAANLVSRGSYGLMQLQLVAARSVLKRYPHIREQYYPDSRKISDVALVKLLLTNREANIHIGCLHLKTYHDIIGDRDKTIVAYNMGIGNALKKDDVSNNTYLQSIEHHISTTVADFNSAHNL